MATVDGSDDVQVPGDAVDDEPTMPELPSQLVLSTDQQFKAIADPLRSKILGIIQTRPATTKQIADRLGEAPGNIGHHVQVLERAGLAQVVATRVVRGIIAKYYTRTARIFTFRFPPEVTGETPMAIDILEHARQELLEAIAAYGDKPCQGAFPHVRISAERAQVYQERLEGLLADLLHEPVDPHGQVYGLVYQMFLAPPYLQDAPASPSRQEDVGNAKGT
jgi:DNA-binding transcriptional ArsR family regulator